MCPCQVSIVNSTWTANHIRQLWWRWGAPVCVFPPCTTDTFQKLPLDRKLKRLYLVSVAQFRPEKNHELQLKAFALARQWAQQDNAGQYPKHSHCAVSLIVDTWTIKQPCRLSLHHHVHELFGWSAHSMPAMHAGPCVASGFAALSMQSSQSCT